MRKLKTIEHISLDGVIKKAILQDLNDIKGAAEQFEHEAFSLHHPW